MFYEHLSIGVLAAVVAFAGGTAPMVDATSARQESSALQTDVDHLQGVGNVGVVSQVVDHGVVTDVRAGVAQRGTTTVVPFDGRHRIGSVTKTFVATVILQLVGEGRIGIDAPLRQYLPNVVSGPGYDDTQITIRQLLQHTSGIFNYTDDTAFARMFTDAKTFNSVKDHHYEPGDLINIATGHRPYFTAGTGYRYSNTDYIVLGEVIKAVTGNTWDVEIANRISTPLGLTGTSYPGDALALPTPTINGYNIFTSTVSKRTYTDTTQDNMTWGGSAGGLISTTSDETKFMSALLGGQLLAPEQMTQMKTGTPFSPTSGLGIGSGSSTCSDGTTRTYWGNSGKVMGYATLLAGSPSGAHTATLVRSTSSVTEQQFTNDDATGQQQWLTDAFCGWPQS